MAKEKMYAKPLYVIGRGCVSVGKKSYKNDGNPIPGGGLTEEEAKKLITSGFLTEAPRRVTAPAGATAEEIAKLKGQIEALEKLNAEQTDKIAELEKENADLRGIVEDGS